MKNYKKEWLNDLLFVVIIFGNDNWTLLLFNVFVDDLEDNEWVDDDNDDNDEFGEDG